MKCLIFFLATSILLMILAKMEVMISTVIHDFWLDLLIKRQSFHHTETSQLICRANQLTGFYMMATLSFNELNI